MPVVKETLKEWKEEVSALYQKARTKEEYEEVVRKRIGYAIKLAMLKESTDMVVSNLLDGYWAEYYLLLKFPATQERKQEFMEMVKNIRNQVKDSNNYAELLYLGAVAWSHLLHKKDYADRLNKEMQGMVSTGRVSTTLTLKWINSRVIEEMDAKNWSAAIGIANEIGQFSKETLEQPKNIGAAANIINNRGTSRVRGDSDINIKEGVKDLVTALDYYLKQTPVPLKHIEGIRNRLMEATKKL